MTVLSTAMAADQPSTVAVEAGQTVTATVDSLLVARERMDTLVSLAQLGLQVPQIKEGWQSTVVALDRCADDHRAMAESAEASRLAVDVAVARADAMARQRNIAIWTTIIVGGLSAAVVTGIAVAD
jgi:hypothetical protein